MEDLEKIRSLIREILEEDDLDEVSAMATGAVRGFSTSIGLKPIRRRKSGKGSKTLKEALAGSPVGDLDFTFHNHIRYPGMDDSYHAEEQWYYYDGIGCLAKSFARAENPIGKSRDSGIKRAIRFLKGELKYPHQA